MRSVAVSSGVSFQVTDFNALNFTVQVSFHKDGIYFYNHFGITQWRAWDRISTSITRRFLIIHPLHTRFLEIVEPCSAIRIRTPCFTDSHTQCAFKNKTMARHNAQMNCLNTTHKLLGWITPFIKIVTQQFPLMVNWPQRWTDAWKNTQVRITQRSKQTYSRHGLKSKFKIAPNITAITSRLEVTCERRLGDDTSNALFRWKRKNLGLAHTCM